LINRCQKRQERCVNKSCREKRNKLQKFVQGADQRPKDPKKVVGSNNDSKDDKAKDKDVNSKEKEKATFKEILRQQKIAIFRKIKSTCGFVANPNFSLSSQ
jgi:hypothetical protein